MSSSKPWLAEARRLREVERLSYAKICRRLGVAHATLYEALLSDQDLALLVVRKNKTRRKAYVPVVRRNFSHRGRSDPPIPSRPEWLPPASLTAALLGDPAPNRSALAQRASSAPGVGR